MHFLCVKLQNGKHVKKYHELSDIIPAYAKKLLCVHVLMLSWIEQDLYYIFLLKCK